MAMEYTEEQLNKLDKTALVQLFLMQQAQLKDIDHKLQLLLEQVAVMNSHRFGRSSEKLEMANQIRFMEIDGTIVYFNEAEAVVESAVENTDEAAVSKPHSVKTAGKRTADLTGLPVIPVEHKMSNDELTAEFGENGWYQLEDEIYSRYRFTPMKIEVEEHHVGVYKSRKDNHFKKADHPAYLLRNSLVSPTLLAGIWNAKYVNATPLYRQEQDFNRMGIAIDRTDMARWTIQCAERYISILYDYLHREMYKYHLLQADETPVHVTKENRSDGSQHYMWVYRTVRNESGGQIVLYEYQPTRRADHPREFLKNFSGICITDGYQVYHTIESEREDLRIAGCYAHARRRFDEALKAVPEESRKSSLAYLALKQIQSIYHEDKKLADLSAEERVLHRRLTVKPLVDALFAWTKQNQCRVSEKSKTGKGFAYLLNQEKYLRVFLEDGNVPLDNNAAEQAIRPFCIGKKNWVMIDTIAGAYQWFRSNAEIVRRKDGTARRMTGVFININSGKKLLMQQKKAVSGMWEIQGGYEPQGKYSNFIEKIAKKYKILSSTEKIEDLLSPDNLRENLSKEKAA